MSSNALRKVGNRGTKQLTFCCSKTVIWCVNYEYFRFPVYTKKIMILVSFGEGRTVLWKR